MVGEKVEETIIAQNMQRKEGSCAQKRKHCIERRENILKEEMEYRITQGKIAISDSSREKRLHGISFLQKLTHLASSHNQHSSIAIGALRKLQYHKFNSYRADRNCSRCNVGLTVNPLTNSDGILEQISNVPSKPCDSLARFDDLFNLSKDLSS